MHLNRFLRKFFYESNSKNKIQWNSVGQDISYTVSNSQFLPTKHVPLPFTVKSLTENAELVKIMNRLGHELSCSKVLTTLIPNNIHQHIPTTAVYRLEETLS